jgi:hypothetical protein
VFVAMAACLLAAACAVRGSALTVYLRCDAGVTGNLLLSVASPEQKKVPMEALELGQACAAGKVDLPRYHVPNALRFSVAVGNAPRVDGAAEYGRDIQADQNSYYTVLKISASPPYVATDRI